MTSNLRWVTPASKLLADPPSTTQRETLKTAATGRPVTASELGDFARLDTLYSDSEREAAIDAATAFVEQELGRAILPQTWTITIEDMWPDEGVMPQRAPVTAISTITTVRPESTDEVWTAAMWYEMPGHRIKAGSSAPTSLNDEDYFAIDYTAGYADAASVPARLNQAIKIIAAEMLIWNRDVGAVPSMWPGNSWQLAREFMVFRGV